MIPSRFKASIRAVSELYPLFLTFYPFLMIASPSAYHTAETILDDVSSSIVRALLYFDIFRYPLTENELWCVCDCISADEHDVRLALEALCRAGHIRQSEEMYFIGRDESVVAERREKNARARKYQAPAAFFSNLIDAFPFTRAVFLSGSLSKDCMDTSSDIDYFIITEPGRLWLNRTLLVLFKKLVLLNSYKFFCVNYFITSGNLAIPDRNMYTAIEIAYLIPTCNSEAYHSFMAHNSWVADYLPHFPVRDTTGLPLAKKKFFKLALERMLSGSFGDRLDALCFRLTVRNQRKKFRHLGEEEFQSAMHSAKDVSKHHPQNFQNHVLHTLAEKYAEFERVRHVRLK